jgi:hypothetical protein
MNQSEGRQITPETPLSITDGAPRVVTMDCGVEVRIPAALDYRIGAAVGNAIGDEFDDIDAAVLMLYSCMHTTPKQVRQMWQKARKPQALYETIQVWMAGQEAGALMAALNELQTYTAELATLQDDDDGKPDTGKKKTGPR